MKYELAAHTREVLQQLKDHHIDVKWVQVGNETTHGFLWPMGRAEENMEQYAGLSQAGYEAVKQVFPDAQVIVHLDGGCDPKRYDFIFDGLKKYGAKWDIIGLSVYPYWDKEAGLEKDAQGTIRDFAINIKRLYEKYGTESMVVETGVESKKPVEGKAIMKAIIDAAYNDCGGHCHGVFYWAPELEGAYPLGAFDNHRPTVIMDAFKEFKPLH
jgi:arabinogalactan endo-1,4-beta-galactosidase